MKMDSTNTGTLIPPADIQRGISSPVQTADPGLYSTTVNMLHDARDVLYPYNSQNMQFYQMPAMVNYSTGELGRHSIQYTPGIGQYPVLQSSARSVNKSVVITNTTNTTTNNTTTTTAGERSAQTVQPKMNTGTALSQGKNKEENRQQVIGDFGNAPSWFSQTMQHFNTKLQQIENHLVNQSVKWQNVEGILQKHNDRIGNIEQQVSELKDLKQSMTHLQISTDSAERETKNVSSKMAEYDDTIHTYSDMCDDIRSEQATCRSENFEIYERLDKIEREHEALKETVVNSDKTIIDLQCRSMRDNLIFTGISEPIHNGGNDEPESEDVEQTLRTFMKDEMQIIMYMPFHRVHRLNSVDRNKRNEGPKPIIAKFERFCDREYVRGQAPKTLVGKPYGVREQFPKVIEEKRRKLYPIMKQYRANKDNKVRLVRDKLYINGYEYYPPEDEQTHAGSAQNRPYEGYKRFTKTIIFERSSKPRRSQQSFSHPTGKTHGHKVLDFSLPQGNKFDALQENGNPNISRRDQAGPSRKQKANSPIDADKNLKKYRERDSSNSGSESENEQSNMQIDAHNSPQSDPPRDEGRTLPKSPIIAVPAPMYQAESATNESLVLNPATGTSSKDVPDTTHTEENSNTVD